MCTDLSRSMLKKGGGEDIAIAREGQQNDIVNQQHYLTVAEHPGRQSSRPVWEAEHRPGLLEETAIQHAGSARILIGCRELVWD